MARETRALVEGGHLHKGDVLAVAELAGIMGSKRTPDLIPLCHAVPITGVSIQCERLDGKASSDRESAGSAVNSRDRDNDV
jgi:cyclic pyranopterin monophosphate synthase